MTLFLRDVPANAVAIGLAVSFVRIAAAFQLVDGAQVIGAGMLRGLHDTRWPLIFALVGYWVVGLGIGSWLAFARDWKGVGIWVGLASGLAAVAALMLVRWVLRDRLRSRRQGRLNSFAMTRHSSAMTRIRLHQGSRDELQPLFAEADDSESEIAAYRDLGDVLIAEVDGEIVGHALIIETGEPGTFEVKSLAVRRRSSLARHWRGIDQGRLRPLPGPRRPNAPAWQRRRRAFRRSNSTSARASASATSSATSIPRSEAIARLS